MTNLNIIKQNIKNFKEAADSTTLTEHQKRTYKKFILESPFENVIETIGWQDFLSRTITEEDSFRYDLEDLDLIYDGWRDKIYYIE